MATRPRFWKIAPEAVVVGAASVDLDCPLGGRGSILLSRRSPRRPPRRRGPKKVTPTKTKKTKKIKAKKTKKSKAKKTKKTKAKKTKAKKTKAKKTKAKKGKKGKKAKATKTKSSAKPTPTKFICGKKTCGKKACSAKGSKGRKGAKSGRKTKTIPLAHKNRELDYNFQGTYAVSRHGTFTNKAEVSWVGGLEGCTGIAIVSEKGYWITHLMEEAFENIPKAKPMWNKLIADVTHGSRRYTVPSTHSDIFSADSNPTIYEGIKTLYHTEINQIMRHIQKGILASAHLETLTYKKPASVAEANRNDGTARGKILIEYTNDQKVDDKTQTPQKAKYRVWLESHKHEHDWSAKANQMGSGSNEEEAPKATVPEYRKHCVTDDSKSIDSSDDAIAEAIALMCSSAKLDVKSLVHKTYSGKSSKTQETIDIDMKIGMSANQKGCKTSTGGKKEIPRIFCKSQLKKALTMCPNTANTGYLGAKPLTWSSSFGCVDLTMHMK
ncbi:hypothetical protein N0V90_011739 [Kalmusia sp. IMI 367209]|nr:hypothetical protein N0V90_011739 [Kalmusia sp. IMI 367209]